MKGKERSETKVNEANNMLIQEKQSPHPEQTAPLSTDRVASSIPKGDVNPAHQETAKPNWEYPSEQMFFNAMKRKGWKPKEEDMSQVVAIHNAVNEQTWRKVLEWERLHSETFEQMPILKRFEGRPKDLSPKARIRHFLGYPLPFDRHDWYIQRGDSQVRYVIDFYDLDPDGNNPASVQLDVRPAIDSFSSFADRIRMNFRKLLS
eukprot:m.12734 g.12734  ORF g.12734 m.12734 type:complete len:205 (+) comp8185_c0_seq1:130-744(+)